jgi:hypothetical protein
MIQKKGEITTAQIVTIIVLIVSFIVILFFFFRLNLGATTNSEICHNSVVLQSKSAKLIGGLQCKTDYVCISGGGDCENMNPTITTKVNPENKDEIMKAIADQMANCWWMFGEGKMDYLGISTDNICGVCSIVGFDDKILGTNSQISYSEFYDYLANTKKDDTQTYLFYLYNINDVETLKQQYPLLESIAGNNILDNEKYTIITGESKTLFTLHHGKYLSPLFIKTNQLSESLSGQCNSFITES